MAVSFISIPDTRDLQTTKAPLIVQAYESANEGEPKYRFILDIKDQAGTLLATLKTFPSGANTDSTAFDISQIVNDYLATTQDQANTSAFMGTLGTTSYSPDKSYSQSGDGTYGQAGQFEIELGYEYALTATGEPVEHRNEDSSTFFAFRNAPQSYVNDYGATLTGDGRYQADVGNTGSITDAGNLNNQFMSGAPLLGSNPTGLAALEMRGTNIQSTESYTLAFSPVEKVATQITRLIDRIYVRCYDASGVQVGTDQAILFSSANGGPSSTPVANKGEYVYYFGAGPKNLEEQTDNATLAGYFSGGTVASYYVWGAYSVTPTNQVTGVFEFTIVDLCSKWPSRRVAYLNKVGAWDYFTLDQRSVKSLSKITRSTYRKGRGNWDAISNTQAWGYGVRDTGETVTNVSAEQLETLSTDWINARFVPMIEDLVTSPAVFVYDSGSPSSAVPVTVTDSSFVTKTNANDKLITYQVKVKYANRPYLQ